MIATPSTRRWDTPLRTAQQRNLEDRQIACQWSGVRGTDTLYAMNGFMVLVGRADRDREQLRLVLLKRTNAGTKVIHTQRFPTLAAALGFAATYTRARCEYVYDDRSA